jgi:hypothetical protein
MSYLEVQEGIRKVKLKRVTCISARSGAVLPKTEK